MKISRVVAPMLLVAMWATAQPYAPEYLPEETRPAWLLTPSPEPTPESRVEAPRYSEAGQRLVDELRALNANATAERELDIAGTDAAAYTLTTRDYVRVFVWLCVIVAAIILLGAAMRRWGKKTPLLAGASLGKVLGRVYLDRNVSLHYVETAGQVLVVAVAPNAVSLVATYDKATFSRIEEAAADATPKITGLKDFEQELQASTARMRAQASGLPADAEIHALQTDIARLQRQLREEAREFSE